MILHPDAQIIAIHDEPGGFIQLSPSGLVLQLLSYPSASSRSKFLVKSPRMDLFHGVFARPGYQALEM